MIGLIVFVVGFILAILLIRVLGAWLLRIDEVINELKGLRKDLDYWKNEDSSL